MKYVYLEHRVLMSSFVFSLALCVFFILCLLFCVSSLTTIKVVLLGLLFKWCRFVCWNFDWLREADSLQMLFSCTARHFTFWISFSLRPKTETKRLNFGLSPELRVTNHRRTNSLTSSLTSSATYHWFRHISLFIFELAKSEVIFVH